MESFVEHTFVILGAYALITLPFFLIFLHLPFRSLPSMLTLPVRSILAILAVAICITAGIFMSFNYGVELRQHFSSIFPYRQTPFLPLVAMPLLEILISIIFKYEKSAWLRLHPERSRLILQAVNRTFQVEGVSISSIDDLNNGRGVSFSWFDGRFIAAGEHKVTFQFYVYSKLKRHAPMHVIYTKNITMRFIPSAVYIVEACPENETFHITRDTKRSI